MVPTCRILLEVPLREVGQTAMVANASDGGRLVGNVEHRHDDISLHKDGIVFALQFYSASNIFNCGGNPRERQRQYLSC